ncbi:MAG: hypothetical protein ACC661_04105, partial [Verrucomicrobiales bacterium]
MRLGHCQDARPRADPSVSRAGSSDQGQRRSFSSFSAGMFLTLVVLLLSATPSLRAGDPGHEPFAAYNYDQTLSNSAQPAPPASTGMLDYTSTNQFLTWKPRAGSLALGAPFSTSGGKLHVASGGVAMVGSLDLTGGNWNTWNNGSGSVGGVNGTTLYFSLLIQVLNPANTSGNQRVWQLRESGSNRFLVGQAWAKTTFSAGSNLGIPLDSNVHLVVVKVEYQSGNDAVSVYWDPDPSLPEPVTPTSTQSRNMSFNEIAYTGQSAGADGFYVDEIRFGTSWATVTPLPAVTYTLTLNPGANGTLYLDPDRTVFNPGETVYLEALSDWGYRFDQWGGDIPAGSENSSRVALTMDQDRTLTPVFLSGKADFSNFDPAVDPYD